MIQRSWRVFVVRSCGSTTARFARPDHSKKFTQSTWLQWVIEVSSSPARISPQARSSGGYGSWLGRDLESLDISSLHFAVAPDTVKVYIDETGARTAQPSQTHRRSIVPDNGTSHGVSISICQEKHGGKRDEDHGWLHNGSPSPSYSPQLPK